MNYRTLRAPAAEFIGTMLFVLVAAGSIVANVSGPAGSLGIALEALFTFILVSAVFGTAVSPQAQRIGGFGVGLALLVCALGGGALTGAVLNPARAFGPALVSWDWHGQAVYWIGPVLGAALAAVAWKFLLLPPSATDIT